MVFLVQNEEQCVVLLSEAVHTNTGSDEVCVSLKSVRYAV